MQKLAELSDHLLRTVAGPMWHGPSLAELLAGVSHEQAARRPIPGAHTIWELVLHISVWAEIARARLRGERIGDPPPEQDWPPMGAPTADRWAAATGRLQESHRALATDVRAFEDETLLRRQVQGLDYTVSTLLHGVIEHGTYHGGQIAVLKRAGISS
jgi:uncharacterized damage-inducible protein DinB